MSKADCEAFQSDVKKFIARKQENKLHASGKEMLVVIHFICFWR